MSKLQRQLTVLCIQHEDEWKRAFKEGKLVVGIQNRSEDFGVVISWYKDDWTREQVVVKRFDDEVHAIRTMKEVKKFVYNKLGE